MRPMLIILALLLILAGGTFALQGINVLPGSFMTGRPEWAIIGTLGVLAGVGLLFTALRQRR